MIPITEIEGDIIRMLEAHGTVLKLVADEKGDFTAKGTFKVMQGKQEVDGYYFASTIKKTKDLRFYFFPVYTHSDAFELSERMQKLLKGKSCFHLNKWDDDLKQELRLMIEKGVMLYSESGLI